jgi:hypothetical protein
MAPKPEMSYSEIAEELGLTVSAVHMSLSRGLKKLRRKGLILTARELSIELERNRATSHSLSRPRSARKGGSA